MKTHRCVECSLMRCSQENETCEECTLNGAVHKVHLHGFINIFKYEFRPSKEFKEGRTWNVYADTTPDPNKGNS